MTAREIDEKKIGDDDDDDVDDDDDHGDDDEVPVTMLNSFQRKKNT